MRVCLGRWDPGDESRHGCGDAFLDRAPLADHGSDDCRGFTGNSHQFVDILQLFSDHEVNARIESPDTIPRLCAGVKVAERRSPVDPRRLPEKPSRMKRRARIRDAPIERIPNPRRIGTNLERPPTYSEGRPAVVPSWNGVSEAVHPMRCVTRRGSSIPVAHTFMGKGRCLGLLR